MATLLLVIVVCGAMGDCTGLIVSSSFLSIIRNVGPLASDFLLHLCTVRVCLGIFWSV